MRRTAATVAVFLFAVAAGIGIAREMRVPAERLALAEPVVEHDTGQHGQEFELTYSALRDLGVHHETMVEHGRSIIRASFEVDPVDKARVDLRILELMWAPSTAPVRGSSDVAAVMTSDATSADRNLMATAHAREGVVIVDSDNVLHGVALFEAGSSSTFEIPPGSQNGVFFLASAARQIRDTGFDPLPTLTICDRSPTIQRTEYASDLEALESYFELLGDVPREQRLASLSDIESTVDELIAQAGSLLDESTGRMVRASRSDLLQQLRSVPDPDNLVVRAAIPVGIRVPETSTDDAAVFVSSSNKPLGWTVLRPHYIGEQGERKAVLDRVVEIAPPEPGDDLLVFFRPLADPWFSCGGAPGEQPVLIVPYEEFAGERRATLDLSQRTYSWAREL